MSQSYVYVVFRLNGRPCYVGKGTGDRLDVHNRGRSSNRHLASIIAKYGELPVVKVWEGESEDEAHEAEKAFIKAIGRKVDGGPLVNVRKGGEGEAGHAPRPRTAAEREATEAKRAATCRKKLLLKISKVNDGKAASLGPSPQLAGKRDAIERALEGLTPERRKQCIRAVTKAVDSGFRNDALSVETRRLVQFSRPFEPAPRNFV